MKRIDIVLIYICIFCWSNLFISGAHFDRAGSGESTLDEVIAHNIPDDVDATININPSESDVNVKNEAHSDNAIDSLSTDELGQVPEAVFSEVNSEYAGVSNEIINNDTPIIVSRTDAATEEIQKMANIPSSSLLMEDVKNTIETTESNTTSPVTQPEEDRSNISTTLKTDGKMPKNATEKNAEDIPSFSEWAQKHLEEAEKKEQVNLSSSNPTVNTSRQGGKMRWKNYASVDCGAKVILANPEAQHSWALLVDSRNEYMLNPCNSRIWFIVELCEAIQLKKIHLGNYELFSSLPKDFTVSLSNRFPTKDWLIVGQFTAQDERDVQNFDINTETFGKYVKVEIKSHYGSEHYCPLSLFRAYGTSEFEVLQKDDPAHEPPIEDDDDDDDPLDDSLEVDSPGNLLSSAADAVLSMVKKAALVLGNKVNKTDESSHKSNETKPDSPIMKTCSSPSHYIVCTNCSDTLFGKIFELLSCKQRQIRRLVSIPYISNALTNSLICQNFGLDFRDKTTSSSIRSGSASVESFFPQYLLGAMCNALAIKYNKVLYNVSHQYANTTENIPKDLLVNFEDEEPKIMPVIGVSSKEIIEEIVSNQPTEPLRLDRPDIMSKSSCSTDTSYASQIKPSKSLATELPAYSEPNTASAVMGQAGESAEDVSQQQQQQNIQPSSSAESSVVEATAEVTTESADLQIDAQAEENVDKLITETSTETNPAVISSPGGGNSQGQKESVFLRLSNRIKALERNMSLSSQYLEELSKRYKKQVEEIQRVLEKTTYSLNEVTTKMDERYKQLEDRLESLTKAVEGLSFEINLWKASCYCLFSGLFLIFLFYCINKCSTPKSATKPRVAPVEIQRRNSADVAIKTVSKKKKRRPSDQALLATLALPGDQEKQPKKRKKKFSSPAKLYNQTDTDATQPCTPEKTPTKLPSIDWVEGKGRVIEDITFPLEESDNSELPPAPELGRIDAPSYITTAATRRKSRSSLKNGKIKNDNEIERRQSSPVASVNGSISSASEQTPKKGKKGLKRLLKIF